MVRVLKIPRRIRNLVTESFYVNLRMALAPLARHRPHRSCHLSRILDAIKALDLR